MRAKLLDRKALEPLQDEMFQLVEELFPIARSITGNGLRETLDRIGERVPLLITEVPTGTRVLDWEIPKEWNIRDAWIATPGGERVVDFRDSNLHVVGYSVPVRERVSLDGLRSHLHSLSQYPEWIPYRTSYYEEAWGFCLQHRRLEALADDEYDVCIDSSLEEGSLTYGEVVLPGRESAEVLVSAHACHPSLANDNLSGVAVAVGLASALSQLELANTYRFLFAPGTIGAIAWLAANRELLPQLRGGVVLAGVGGPGPITYKRSRRGDAEIDRAALAAARENTAECDFRPFTPDGYDERQFCSPGFDLPVGRLSRTAAGEYPEYHTSADDLSFVRAEVLADSLDFLLGVVEILERNETLTSAQPFGEPHLSRRGIVLEQLDGPAREAVRWLLNLSDGEHDLLSISERSGVPFSPVSDAADFLRNHGLLR